MICSYYFWKKIGLNIDLQPIAPSAQKDDSGLFVTSYRQKIVNIFNFALCLYCEVEVSVPLKVALKAKILG